MRRKIFIAAFTLGIFATAAGAEYPDKPVTFVIPFPPGDLEDVLTRIIAEEFQKEYGVPAAVVNKPGGGGGPIPGAMEVANGPSDGSVIGSFVNDVTVVGPSLGIDGLSTETFDVVGIFLTYPFVIAASADAPYQTMRQLADYAQTNNVVLGHFGPPFAPTQVTLALAKSMNFEWGGDATFDTLDCNTLASGDADVINTTIQSILPCLDRVTILASLTSERISKVPDAPTVAEIEPRLALTLWNGLFVKSEVKADVRAKIREVAKQAMLGPKAQKISQETGANVYWMEPSDAEDRIKIDRKIMVTIRKLVGG